MSGREREWYKSVASTQVLRQLFNLSPAVASPTDAKSLHPFGLRDIGGNISHYHGILDASVMATLMADFRHLPL
jgi:hypothetical protein